MFSDWAYYTTRHVEVEDVYGVYQLSISRKDESHITYIGWGRLRSELLEHILGDPCRSPSMYFRYEKASGEEEAERRAGELLREFEERYGRPPKCNEDGG